MDLVKSFKGCLPQILLGPFLNTLTHIYFHRDIINSFEALKKNLTCGSKVQCILLISSYILLETKVFIKFFKNLFYLVDGKT